MNRYNISFHCKCTHQAVIRGHHIHELVLDDPRLCATVRAFKVNPRILGNKRVLCKFMKNKTISLTLVFRSFTLLKYGIFSLQSSGISAIFRSLQRCLIGASCCKLIPLQNDGSHCALRNTQSSPFLCLNTILS